MASKLTHGQVRRIAELARLELSDAEVDLFAAQLSTILTYAAEVQRIDTTGVIPTAHAVSSDASHADATNGATSWRADDPAPGLTRAEALANAPDAALDAGLFRVPKVL